MWCLLHASLQKRTIFCRVVPTLIFSNLLWKRWAHDKCFFPSNFPRAALKLYSKEASSFFSSLIALRVHNSKLLLHAGLFSFLCHNSSNKMVPCNHKGWTCGRWSPPGGKTAVQANPNLINIIFWFFSKRDLDMKKKRLEWNVLDSQYQSSWHTGSSSPKSSKNGEKWMTGLKHRKLGWKSTNWILDFYCTKVWIFKALLT